MTQPRDKFPEDIHVFGGRYGNKGTKYVTVLPTDSAMDIFSKIQKWDIKDQVSIALRIIDDRADPLFSIIQNHSDNKQHEEYINTVTKQINLMSQPVKGLLQIEINAFMHTFLNNNPTFLGSKRIIEDLESEIIGIPASIERLKFQRKKENPKKEDIDDYSIEITELKQFKKFLIAAHNRFSRFPKQKQNVNLDTPHSFEDLFYNPINSIVCLSILSKLDPPAIDSSNRYIGNNKGIIPLWIKVLRGQNLIKPVKDTVYSKILNEKIEGLKLTVDASEFRKNYARLDSAKSELHLKAILSRFSQEGKLGK